MKLTYYGTAAAEGMPALFCYCEHCERALKAGGKNIRTRSQALINDDLLIDLPPDTYMHVLDYGLDLRSIEHILITHAHEDHLYPLELGNIRQPFAHRLPQAGPVNVYVSPWSSAAVINGAVASEVMDDKHLCVHTVKPFVPFAVKGYTITPLAANHDSRLNPLIYIVSDGEKTLLYGNDTGWFPQETWAYLEKSGVRFDFVSLDCTCTRDTAERPGGHMNLVACRCTKEELVKIGCADEKTVFCLHHFSHNGGYTYDELVPVAAQMGFLVSYDSMSVEI